MREVKRELVRFVMPARHERDEFRRRRLLQLGRTRHQHMSRRQSEAEATHRFLAAQNRFHAARR